MKDKNQDAMARFVQRTHDFINNEMSNVLKSFEGLLSDVVSQAPTAQPKPEKKNEAELVSEPRHVRINPEPAFSVKVKIDPSPKEPVKRASSEVWDDLGARALMSLFPSIDSDAGKHLSMFWRDMFYAELKRAFNAERNTSNNEAYRRGKLDGMKLWANNVGHEMLRQLKLILVGIESWETVNEFNRPREGDKFIVYHEKHGVDRGYIKQGEITGAWQFGSSAHDKPTHWMKMPPGPYPAQLDDAQG